MMKLLVLAAMVALAVSAPAEVKPCICSRGYFPVCGSDGKTYDNACLAGCDGIKVLRSGSCEEPEEDEQPALPKLCICTREYFPVCGSNGKTYGNACAARCEGISVLRSGTCEEAVQLPIIEKPCICTREYMPVCGINGRTYGNACTARCANINILRSGTCDEPAQLPIIEKPCICTMEYRPVCGSDGVTRGNPCMARCAGITVYRSGRCEVSEEGPALAAQPLINRDCACTRELFLVCGGDGKTYSNVCVARCAGVNVLRAGRCEQEVNPLEAAVKRECICTLEYAPVCGSDAEGRILGTFGNACSARCAGAKILRSGQC